MKLRVLKHSHNFGVVVGKVYEAALVADTAFTPDPSDPYKDMDGDYWIANDGTLSFDRVCIGPIGYVEVVE